MSENINRRDTITKATMAEMPSDYIKAKLLNKMPGKTLSIAGFEAGDPTPRLVTDPYTGKKRIKVELNGMVHVEADGSCLILDTLFNRLKLQRLCKPGTIKIPKDSKGVEFTVKTTKPDFVVEDESIFDGLEPIGEQVVEEKAKAKPITLPKGKGKGLGSISEVEAAKAAQEAQDNAEGVGGGRRPETSAPGELKLDVE